MKSKSILIVFAALMVLGAFAVDAKASACRNPGSLLLFPYYNTHGVNALSITQKEQLDTHDSTALNRPGSRPPR